MCNMTKELTVAGMFCGAILIGLCGCANPEAEISRDRHSPDFERSAALSFFNGEVNALFTNAQGFKAHLAVEPIAGSFTNETSRASGELWGRDGKLLFIPALSSRRHKYAGTAGTTFLWDNGSRSGYAINDLLQGFAPLPRHAGSTNRAPESEITLMGTENVGSEACQKIRVTNLPGDNNTNSLIAWRALSLNGFPIQIQTGLDLNASLVRFSKVRFETPPADLFSLPEGLTRYDSVDAMLYELARREGEVRGVHGASPDSPSGIYRKQ